uniref:Uncharacterized protein n=1 Tax=Lepeophtheirus salmonis TaxID=72036 RepID=A0A0K2U355_LEPSM
MINFDPKICSKTEQANVHYTCIVVLPECFCHVFL